MAATRRSMIVRMFRLMDKVMETMEPKVSADSIDKDVDLLGKLVVTLGKLIDIDRTAGNRAAPRQAKEMLALRDQLVRRIAELKRS